jgi:hypothetical protein
MIGREHPKFSGKFLLNDLSRSLNKLLSLRIYLRVAPTFLRRRSIQIPRDEIIFFLCFRSNLQLKRLVSDYQYLQLTLQKQFSKQKYVFWAVMTYSSTFQARLFLRSLKHTQTRQSIFCKNI